MFKKIKDIIKEKTGNSDDYDDKYLRTKTISDDLTLQLPDVITQFRPVFHDKHKHILKI